MSSTRTTDAEFLYYCNNNLANTTIACNMSPPTNRKPLSQYQKEVIRNTMKKGMDWEYTSTRLYEGNGTPLNWTTGTKESNVSVGFHLQSPGEEKREGEKGRRVKVEGNQGHMTVQDEVVKTNNVSVTKLSRELAYICSWYTNMNTRRRRYRRGYKPDGIIEGK